MNFYDYWNPNEAGIENPVYEAALCWIGLGFKVLAVENKEPIKLCRPTNKLRVRPMHEKNADWYFKDPADLAVFTGEGLEVVDIDCKYDQTGRLYNALMRAIRYAVPDVYEKLVIQQTANAGYHLFYKCPQIGGNTDLAQRPASSQELKAGDRVFTLIETRGEGGYVVVSPSPGYEFIKGTPGDIQTITPEDRAILLAVCRSFDKMPPVPLERMSKNEVDRQDAPWNVFNARNGADWVRKTLEERGWEILDYKEDRDKIYVLRPGATSKSSGVIWKESGILFLFTPNTEFEDNRGYSPFQVLCQLNYGGDFKACAKDQADQGVGVFNLEDGEFHFTTREGHLRPKLRAIVEWMNDIGIARYYLNKRDFEIVHVVDKTVRIVDTTYIKNIFCSYIHRSCSAKVDEFFLSKFVNIFSRESLITLVSVVQAEQFLRPQMDQAYLLFNNTALLVTRDDTKYIPFNDLPGLVWYDNIIQRDIIAGSIECEMGTFITQLAAQSAERIDMFRSAIGYLLHPFKDPSNPRAVVLLDEYFQEDDIEEPEGGTGKGMFIQAMSKFKRTVTLDGKNFRHDKSFAYQRINIDTEVVAFEDVYKGFNFEKLFSIITEGWTIEKKGKDEIHIPFELSPKIIFTSNYALKGASASHQRRRYEIEVAAHYSPHHTVRDEFGHLFFYDWSTIQWNSFDNYMVDCLQFYLQHGFVEGVHFNLDRRRLIEEVGKDFIDWIETKTIAKILSDKIEDQLVWREEKATMLTLFTDKHPTWRNKLTNSRLTKWLQSWCSFHAFYMDSRHIYNGLMCYTLKIDVQTVRTWNIADLPEPGLPF